MSYPTTPPELFPNTDKRPPDDVRPWGAYWVLDDAETHKVKRLRVNPGQRISLQYHHKREEHWLVVQGIATITVDDRTWDANPGERVFIPKGARHRLGNQGKEPVDIIEVQLGSYFGEDDIVRLDDDYQRNTEEA